MRTRAVNDISPNPNSKGLRTRGTHVWGQEKMDVPAQAERANSPLPPLFVRFRPSVDWMVLPLWWGQSHLFFFFFFFFNRCYFCAPARDSVSSQTGAVSLCAAGGARLFFFFFFFFFFNGDFFWATATECRSSQTRGVSIVAQWKRIWLLSMKMPGITHLGQALLWAVMQITDAAQIPPCCGYVVGQQL